MVEDDELARVPSVVRVSSVDVIERAERDLVGAVAVDIGEVELVPKVISKTAPPPYLVEGGIEEHDLTARQRDEAQALPEGFPYYRVEGLSNELKDKLMATRPETLGQAARIDGMTPAALTLILARLRQMQRRTA